MRAFSCFYIILTAHRVAVKRSLGWRSLYTILLREALARLGGIKAKGPGLGTGLKAVMAFEFCPQLFQRLFFNTGYIQYCLL